MKYFILFLSLAGALSVQAQQKQSLKDLLYSGKLKKDSTGVVRSTDDLSSKIDTTTKKPSEPVKPVAVPVVSQSKQPVAVPGAVTSAPVQAGSPESVETAVKDSVVAAAVEPVSSAGPLKTNTRLWKEYIDTLTKALKSEVLSSKQIKKGDYYVTIDYEIGLDGNVVISKVTSGPESPFLQSQVQQMLEANPPHLNPYLDGANQPKKVKRKQNFSITKD